jgi:hypothetical protein
MVSHLADPTYKPQEIARRLNEALAYLRDQPTALLDDMLSACTDPRQAVVISLTLTKRCDGSGVRIHSDGRTVLGLCGHCAGLGEHGDPACRS